MREWAERISEAGLAEFSTWQHRERRSCNRVARRSIRDECPDHQQPAAGCPCRLRRSHEHDRSDRDLNQCHRIGAAAHRLRDCFGVARQLLVGGYRSPPPKDLPNLRLRDRPLNQDSSKFFEFFVARPKLRLSLTEPLVQWVVAQQSQDLRLGRFGV